MGNDGPKGNPINKGDVKIGCSKLESYLNIIKDRKMNELKKVRSDLIKSLKQQKRKYAVDLAIQRILCLQKQINCIHILKISVDRIQQKAQSFVKAKSLKQIDSIVCYLANICLSFETFGLGTVTNFKTMILSKFGSFDFKTLSSPQVLTAVAQSISDQQKYNFVRQISLQNKIPITNFGQQYADKPLVVPKHDQQQKSYRPVQQYKRQQVPGYQKSYTHHNQPVPGYSYQPYNKPQDIYKPKPNKSIQLDPYKKPQTPYNPKPNVSIQNDPYIKPKDSYNKQQTINEDTFNKPQNPYKPINKDIDNKYENKGNKDIKQVYEYEQVKKAFDFGQYQQTQFGFDQRLNILKNA